MYNLFIYILFVILALALIPIFDSILKSIKAIYNWRSPLQIFQSYYDLIKLFNKVTIQSQFTSFFSYIWPLIILVNSLLFFFLVPVVNVYFDINIIYLFFILSLGNFFMIVYAMDNSTYFSWLWAEREIFVLSIVESVIILTVVLLAMIWWYSEFSWLNQIFSQAILSPFQMIFYLVLVVAFFYIILAENNRFPFDNPATHLELTMIHEAMLLETQGKQLAIMEIASKIKMFWFIWIFTYIFLPFSFGITNIFWLFLLWIAKVFIVVFFIATWEALITKIRIFKYQEVFVTILISQILLMVFYILK